MAHSKLALTPGDFTVRSAPRLIAEGLSWAELMPEPQQVPADLIEEGRTIPVARVQAMHEGKRRARLRDSTKPSSRRSGPGS